MLASDQSLERRGMIIGPRSGMIRRESGSTVISQRPSQGSTWSHHLWLEPSIFTPVAMNFFFWC